MSLLVPISDTIPQQPGQTNFLGDLFNDPLSDRLPLWQRVVNIVFHILTLCIPLILSKCCNARIGESVVTLNATQSQPAAVQKQPVVENQPAARESLLE